MKPRFSNQSIHALTLVEVLVVIAVLAVIAAIFLPALAAAKRKSSRIGCVDNLKEIDLAIRIWAGDNGDTYPMGVSVTNGGSMEMVNTGDVTQTFMVMSNELSTPKILHCPQDMARTGANVFSGLASSNISYFVCASTTNELNPQLIISGDSNFEIGGVPVTSGLLDLPRAAPVAWTAARHKFFSYIGLADGSVQQLSQNGLLQALQSTGLATNRLAIP